MSKFTELNYYELQDGLRVSRQTKWPRQNKQGITVGSATNKREWKQKKRPSR